MGKEVAVHPENMDWRSWADTAADEFNVLNSMHLGSTPTLYEFAVDALYWNPNVPCTCDATISPALEKLARGLGLCDWQLCHFVQNVHAHASQMYHGTGIVRHSPTGHAEEAYILTAEDARDINAILCLGHEPIFARTQTWLSRALLQWSSQRTRICIPCDDAKVDKIIADYEGCANALLNSIVARAECAHDSKMRACTHVHEIRNEREALMVVDIILKVKKE